MKSFNRGNRGSKGFSWFSNNSKNNGGNKGSKGFSWSSNNSKNIGGAMDNLKEVMSSYGDLLDETKKLFEQRKKLADLASNDDDEK